MPNVTIPTLPAGAPGTSDLIIVSQTGTTRTVTLSQVLTLFGTNVFSALAVDPTPDSATDYFITWDTSAGVAKQALMSTLAASDTAVGLSELATAAETIAGTDTARTLTPAGFAGNKALTTNGYYRFPGFIVQWGTASLTSSGADHSFPLTFPTACLAMVTAPVGASLPSVNNVIVHTIVSTSIFRMWAPAVNTVQWLAVGY